MRLYILLKINKVEKITKTYLEGIKVLIEEEEEKKKKSQVKSGGDKGNVLRYRRMECACVFVLMTLACA